MSALPYPHPADAAVSKRMKRNRRRDTGPELAVRTLLHARGLRFRVDYAIRLPTLTVRPDVAFTRWRVAVFIDGCFWHRCPEHGNLPKRNLDYWIPKLDRNARRDERVQKALSDAGWIVVRGWEHEQPEVVSDRIASALSRQRTAAASDGVMTKSPRSRPSSSRRSVPGRVP